MGVAEEEVVVVVGAGAIEMTVTVAQVKRECRDPVREF
jgi:hypothetical protein